MVLAWISLSTRWELTSVQAALNVIISVLGTVGIWSFARFWWQYGCASIIRQDSKEVPLESLLIVSSLGEAWDAAIGLRLGLFHRQNRFLVVQLVVVVLVTVGTMFAGPIAKVSLRSTETVQSRPLQVLRTVKGDSWQENLIEANVYWNDTIASLNHANFPMDQLLDYLPLNTEPWTYVPHEWDPTWKMTCNHTPETMLPPLTAEGNNTFANPIDAFPPFRETFDPKWLNKSKYRRAADFSDWSTTIPDFIFTDMLNFVLIESDPLIDDRLYWNNETMEFSLSVLHLKHFNASNNPDTTLDSEDEWFFRGPVANASFARLECNINRMSHVENEAAIPWPWTNDTYAITFSYRTFFCFSLENATSKGIPVPTPTPFELLRVWQAYMVSMNTIYAKPTIQSVSVLLDTVQLSTVFLVFIVVLTLLTAWSSVRYFVFLRRNRRKLDSASIPDSKFEWMVHGAKTVLLDEDKEHAIILTTKDRDFLRVATFGTRCPDITTPDSASSIKRPSLARIHVSKEQSPNRSGSPRALSALSPSTSEHQSVSSEERGKHASLLRVPSITDASIISTRSASFERIDERSDVNEKRCNSSERPVRTP